jgi:mRNA interferase RelE/StbE
LRKFKVLLSETARRQLKALPTNLRDRVKSSLARLGEDPFKPRPKADIKMLRGPHRYYFRLRVGDYRAIYVIEDDKVMVAKIILRSKAYDWLD